MSRSSTLLLAALSLAGCRSARPSFAEMAPRELVLREEGVELPLDLAQRVPIVTGLVNGRGPYRFLVDTGAPFSSVTAALAAELGLEDAGLRVPGPRGELATVRLASLELGGVALVDTIAVLSESALTYAADGVLGFNTFLDVTARFDFARARLRLSRERLAGPPDGRRLLEDLGALHRPMVRVDFDGGAGAKWSAPFLLDTGSDSGIFLPAEVEALPFECERVGELEVVTAYGPARWELVRIAAVARLGELELERPVVTMHPESRASVFPADVGLIGMRLLERQVVTFDARAGLVRIEPPES